MFSVVWRILCIPSISVSYSEPLFFCVSFIPRSLWPTTRRCAPTRPPIASGSLTRSCRARSLLAAASCWTTEPLRWRCCPKVKHLCIFCCFCCCGGAHLVEEVYEELLLLTWSSLFYALFNLSYTTFFSQSFVILGTQHGEIVCKVNNQGVLGNKKGENFHDMVKLFRIL